jgi:2-dehydropantoate 2-reductase
VKELAQIFETADLHYIIQEDIQSFHVSHVATAIVIKHFYANGVMMDIETARSESTLRKIAKELKQNIRLVEQSGTPVIPSETKAMGEMSEEVIISMYRRMLSNDFTIDVLLGNHAVSAKTEIMLLDELFRRKMQK